MNTGALRCGVILFTVVGWFGGLLSIVAYGAEAGVGNPQQVRVLPWNGHKAALSLTYDDADPCHLDIAIPEMEKRGLKGTFFVVAKDMVARKDEWKRAADAGHEIANHTATHPHAKGLTPEQVAAEVDGARKTIEQVTGHRVVTFAYPFVEVTPEMSQRVAQDHLAARGGQGRVQPLQGDVQWMDIPSFTTLTRTTRDEYRQWFAKTTDTGGWCVLMIHGIEGTRWGWEPVSRAIYTDVLDEAAARKDELWTATFAEVAAYLRAQKQFEAAQANADGATTSWTWQRPAIMPEGVVLKVRVEGNARLEQAGNVIQPDAQGVYRVRFDVGVLQVTRL
jgi:sialate O-acetylesterase